MADTTSVIIDPSTTNLGTIALDAWNKALEISSTNLSKLRTVMETSSPAGLTEDFSKATSVVNTLAVAFLNTSSVFETFNSKLGTNNLYTYTDQIKQLKEHFAGNESGLVNALSQVGNALGIGKGLIAQYSAAGSENLEKFINTYAKHADSTLRFRQGILDNASATGQFGDILNAAGSDLSGLDNITLNYQHQMEEAGKATLLGTKNAAAFFTELSKIPNTLNQNIVGMQGVGSSTTMLAAAMNVAVGTGMSLTDVTNGLRKAFDTYGISGQAALTFVARMSEVSQKLHIELSDARSFSEHLAESFKFLGNNAESTTRILDTMFESIKKGGISNKSAIEIIQQMTTAVGAMGITERAYLSSQSGGPGGLMGSFQISKMMREGKMDDVMAMVRKQVTSQTGRIVSMDEAASSQGAAAQLTRQLQIIQSGPLGKFAKDEASAMRLLDGLRDMETTGPKAGLSKNILEDVQGKATKIEENQSYTELVRVNATLDEIQSNTSMMAYKATRQVSEAGLGTLGSSRNLMSEGNREGNMLRQGAVNNSPMTINAQTAKTWGDAFNQIEGFGKMIMSSIGDSAKSAYAKGMDIINKAKIKITENVDLAPEDKQRQLKTLELQKTRLNEFYKKRLSEEGTGVGGTAPFTATIPARAPARPAAGGAQIGSTNALAGNAQNVIVTINAYCKDCGKKIPSEQEGGTNPTVNL